MRIEPYSNGKLLCFIIKADTPGDRQLMKLFEQQREDPRHKDKFFKMGILGSSSSGKGGPDEFTIGYFGSEYDSKEEPIT